MPATLLKTPQSKSSSGGLNGFKVKGLNLKFLSNRTAPVTPKRGLETDRDKSVIKLNQNPPVRMQVSEEDRKKLSLFISSKKLKGAIDYKTLEFEKLEGRMANEDLAVMVAQEQSKEEVRKMFQVFKNNENHMGVKMIADLDLKNNLGRFSKLCEKQRLVSQNNGPLMENRRMYFVSEDKQLKSGVTSAAGSAENTPTNKKKYLKVIDANVFVRTKKVKKEAKEKNKEMRRKRKFDRRQTMLNCLEYLKNLRKMNLTIYEVS